jgi:rhodanese-related sulfurtransferase
MGRVHWLQKWVLPQWFRELPKERPIVVICLTAHRSPIAADALLKAGFKQVFNLTGGMMEWKRLGFRIAK